MENFLWKVFFPKQQQQKRDWDQRPLKLTVCPRPLALWTRGSLGRWSWPGQLYTRPSNPQGWRFIFICSKGYWCGKVWEAPLYKESLEPQGHWSLSRKIHPVPSVLGCLSLPSTCDHGVPIGGRVFRVEGSLGGMFPVVLAQEVRVVWFSRQN